MGNANGIFVAGFEAVLLKEAEDAAQIADTTDTPREEGAKALSAILLSVAAVEAAVGTWTAVFKDDYRIDDTTLRAWRGRSPPDVMKDILGRLPEPVETGNLAWFERFCAIVKLRNRVAHYFPEYHERGTWPDDLRPYIGKIFEPAGDATMDWTSRLIVGSVARQVVSHAGTAIDEFIKLAWQ